MPTAGVVLAATCRAKFRAVMGIYGMRMKAGEGESQGLGFFIPCHRIMLGRFAGTFILIVAVNAVDSARAVVARPAAGRQLSVTVCTSSSVFQGNNSCHFVLSLLRLVKLLLRACSAGS